MQLENSTPLCGTLIYIAFIHIFTNYVNYFVLSSKIVAVTAHYVCVCAVRVVY